MELHALETPLGSPSNLKCNIEFRNGFSDVKTYVDKVLRQNIFHGYAHLTIEMGDMI